MNGWEIVGIVGGGLSVLACVVGATVYLRKGNVGAGVGLLVLSPVAFLVGTFAIAIIAMVAVLTLSAWIVFYDGQIESIRVRFSRMHGR